MHATRAYACSRTIMEVPVNILDYLSWRGDVPFMLSPFNEADALLLCQLSYIDFSDIVSAEHNGRSITVLEAADRYFALHDKREIYGASGLVSPVTPFLLRKMAAGARFKGARLTHYQERFDQEGGEQFAAITIILPDGISFVAFRGTDDTLVGWREDFDMSYMVVPAQRDALAYLQEAANATKRRLRVGGHSKGGNLALYACALTDEDVRKRIDDIFVYDAPGFSEGTLPPSAVENLRDRVHRRVPEFCVIGNLMEQPFEATAVRAGDASLGLMQHSALNWETTATGLTKAPGITEDSLRFALVFNEAVERRTPEERRSFIDAVFGALSASGATTMGELAHVSPAGVHKLAQAFGALDEDMRDEVEELVGALLGQGVFNASAPLRRGLERALGIEVTRTSRAIPLKTVATQPSIEEMERYREKARARKRRISLTRLAAQLSQPTALRSSLLAALSIILIANAVLEALALVTGVLLIINPTHLVPINILLAGILCLAKAAVDFLGGG